MASITALLLSILLGPWLIARLREFQIGQHIREDGPKSHQKKAGTPTMGGLLICVAIVVPTLLWAQPAHAGGVGGAGGPGAVSARSDSGTTYTKVAQQAQSGADGAARSCCCR